MTSEALLFGAQIPRSRRAAVLGMVITVHAALLALAMTIGQHTAKVQLQPSFTVISVAEPKAPSAPVRALPSKTPSQLRVATPALVADIAPGASGGPAADSCPTLDAVTQGIVTDPAAETAIAEAPADTRSIADAIVIWNGGWSVSTDPVAQPLAPLAAVRSAVLASLGSVSPRCLDEQVAGPRFIPVPVGDRTRLLVFGSGNWTWHQIMLDTSTPATSPQSGGAAPMPPGG